VSGGLLHALPTGDGAADVSGPLYHLQDGRRGEGKPGAALCLRNAAVLCHLQGVPASAGVRAGVPAAVPVGSAGWSTHEHIGMVRACHLSGDAGGQSRLTSRKPERRRQRAGSVSDETSVIHVSGSLIFYQALDINRAKALHRLHGWPVSRRRTDWRFGR
jgi:hypothetical protein